MRFVLREGQRQCHSFHQLSRGGFLSCSPLRCPGVIPRDKTDPSAKLGFFQLKHFLFFFFFFKIGLAQW